MEQKGIKTFIIIIIVLVLIVLVWPNGDGVKLNSKEYEAALIGASTNHDLSDAYVLVVSESVNEKLFEGIVEDYSHNKGGDYLISQLKANENVEAIYNLGRFIPENEGNGIEIETDFQNKNYVFIANVDDVNGLYSTAFINGSDISVDDRKREANAKTFSIFSEQHPVTSPQIQFGVELIQFAHNRESSIK